MEEFVRQMAEKAGIDRATADKVVGLLGQHAGQVPNMLSGDGSALTSLLSRLGLDNAVIGRIVAFLKANASKLPELLGQEGGILAKAKDVLSGMLGGKEGK
jgi:hypothetical protein